MKQRLRDGYYNRYMRGGIFASLLLLFVFLTAKAEPAVPPMPAQPERDSIRISLLTCAAGGEIYSLFGHTAIRYECPSEGIDAVFNYGLFDFGAPHFVLRFALGETDYQLGVTRYDRFAAEYAYLGRDVCQQTLNLTGAEKQRLLALLETNYLPENRIYRYNFFFDNCATRPRDQIERAIATDARLAYADSMEMPDIPPVTFRDLLHRYSKGHPWSRFGMDLCMGSQADRPASRRETMFVPFLLQAYFRRATVTDSLGRERPLVAEEKPIVVTGKSEADFRSAGIGTPLCASLGLLVLTVACTAYGMRRGKSLWGLDFVLFVAAGVAGAILAFLVLFSQHPAVSPNYLLFVFHPLHLCALPWMLYKVRKHKKNCYSVVNLVVLTLFIVLWPFLPQRFPIEVLPLALCLLIRSGSHVFRSKYIRPRK